MSVYLIRHTAPLIEKGICYGQSDLDVMPSFEAEATIIRQCLPADLQRVYSSPLLRCHKLAVHLFPGHNIIVDHDLKELHCGEWELQRWDDIPRHVIDPWMKDFVNAGIPGGESYVQLFDRVVRCFEKIMETETSAAIVAHGGVIRSILAHITGTPLLDSFSAFSLHYGCVVRINKGEGAHAFEILSNIATVKEQHKPSYR